MAGTQLVNGLPWRGPGPGRPDLPLPPRTMPMTFAHTLRKRWRYVGVYDPALMLFAAEAEVGPLRQGFWALWDRERGERFAASPLRPGSREVRMEGQEVRIAAREVQVSLKLGDCAAVECVCPSGRGYAWTRKRAGLPVLAQVRAGSRELTLEALGVDDQSAGYHQRRTSWQWSAGVGRSGAGERIAWNLVNGLNDPPERSERGIWVDGVLAEPAPVSFATLTAIRFEDGSVLRFQAEAERSQSRNLLLVRSRYRHRFGTFAGSLAGVRVDEAFGVMEEHEALW